MSDPVTTLGIPYPVGSDLVSNGPAEMQAMAEQTDALFSHPVTALPTSGQFDGQVIDFIADPTNGIVWRFRYRAASPSTLKWEFVGGAPMHVAVAGVGASATTGYLPISVGSLSEMTLSLPALPNGGDFDIEVGASIFATGTGTGGYLSYATNVAASDAWAARLTATSVGSSFGEGPTTVSRVYRQLALPGSTVIILEARSSTATTVDYTNPWLRATPVRVG